MLPKLTELCAMFVSMAKLQASDAHLDLISAPYALYGVKYIDPVSL